MLDWVDAGKYTVSTLPSPVACQIPSRPAVSTRANRIAPSLRAASSTSEVFAVPPSGVVVSEAPSAPTAYTRAALDSRTAT